MGAADPWFDSLYKENSKKLFKIANTILKNRSVSEELVQDAFTVLLLNREKVETYDHPEAFLFQVLRNRIGSEIQRECYKREEPLGEKHMLIAANSFNNDRIEDVIPKWVKEEDRQMLIWRIEYGFTFQEIAERLHTTEHACHARMYRLRKELKKRMKENGNIL